MSNQPNTFQNESPLALVRDTQETVSGNTEDLSVLSPWPELETTPLSGDAESIHLSSGYANGPFASLLKGLPAQAGSDNLGDEYLSGSSVRALMLGVMASLAGDFMMPHPSSPVLRQQLQWLRRSVYGVNTRPENGYIPTERDIHDACTRSRALGGNPRCLVLSVPNPVTGLIYNTLQCSMVVKACRQEGLAILVDESARWLFPGKKMPRLLKEYSEGTITVDGYYPLELVTSESVAWAVFPKTQGGLNLKRTVEKYMKASIGTMLPAFPALENKFVLDRYQSATTYVGLKTKLLLEPFKRWELDVAEPLGGSSFYVNFNRYSKSLRTRFGIHNAKELHQYLQKSYGFVLDVPSEVGAPEDAFCLRFSTMALGDDAKLFSRWCASKRKETFISPKNHPGLFKAIACLDEFLGELV